MPPGVLGPRGYEMKWIKWIKVGTLSMTKNIPNFKLYNTHKRRVLAWISVFLGAVCHSLALR